MSAPGGDLGCSFITRGDSMESKPHLPPSKEYTVYNISCQTALFVFDAIYFSIHLII